MRRRLEPKFNFRSGGRRRQGRRTRGKPAPPRSRSSRTGRRSTLTIPAGCRRRKSIRRSSSAADREPAHSVYGLELDLVAHDPIVLPEAVLFIDPPGRRVSLFRDEVHHPIARVSGLADRCMDEPRADSPTLVVRMNVELVELRPPVDTAIEPCGLERRPPHDEADRPAVGLRDRDAAAAVPRRVVDEEHRVDAAQVRGIVDAKRPKPGPGGLPSRHDACTPPPLSTGWTRLTKDLP